MEYYQRPSDKSTDPGASNPASLEKQLVYSGILDIVSSQILDSHAKATLVCFTFFS